MYWSLNGEPAESSVFSFRYHFRLSLLSIQTWYSLDLRPKRHILGDLHHRVSGTCDDPVCSSCWGWRFFVEDCQYGNCFRWLGCVIANPDSLSCFFEGLVIFTIVSKLLLDSILSFVTFLHRLEVDWMLADLQDPFFLFVWCMHEVIGLSYKRVHELILESNGYVLRRELRILAISIRLKADF